MQPGTRLRKLPLFIAAAAGLLVALHVPQAHASEELRMAVGLFQPDRNKNDQTYQALANYLSRELGRHVSLKTVDSWEGLAKSLAAGETDLALMGPWGYIIANNEAGAQVVATILYDGRPSYRAIIVVNSKSGITQLGDLKGKSFAFGDAGSTSGYLIPSNLFQSLGIKPDKYFSRIAFAKHQAIEIAVSRGDIDAGADYDRNRTAMIEQGLIDPQKTRIIWESIPLPNDALAVSAELAKDGKFVERLRKALSRVSFELERDRNLLPPHYTGFVPAKNADYSSIREAGVSTGKLRPRQ